MKTIDITNPYGYDNPPYMATVNENGKRLHFRPNEDNATNEGTNKFPELADAVRTAIREYPGETMVFRFDYSEKLFNEKACRLHALYEEILPVLGTRQAADIKALRDQHILQMNERQEKAFRLAKSAVPFSPHMTKTSEAYEKEERIIRYRLDKKTDLFTFVWFITKYFFTLQDECQSRNYDILLTEPEKERTIFKKPDISFEQPNALAVWILANNPEVFDFMDKTVGPEFTVRKGWSPCIEIVLDTTK